MFSNIGAIAQGRPLLDPNVRLARVENYKVTQGPALEPLTLAEVKEWLMIPDGVTEQDNVLTSLIIATRIFFESYTNRILINTTFRHYGNCFAQSMEYARGPLQSLVNFLYLVDGNFIPVPNVYQVLDEPFYWRIIFSQFQNIPENKDDNINIYQGIITDFVAGYGNSQSDIPEDIKVGLYNHIAFLYENRGDCEISSCASCEDTLPPVSRMIYNKYRHQTAFGSKFRGI